MKIANINKKIQQINADEGKYLHKIGTEDYFTAAIMLASETESDYEEVESIPSPELENARKLKLNEIKQADDASNEFFINGVSMWLDKTTRASLTITLPALKTSGATTAKLWGMKNDMPISFDVGIDKILTEILPALEVYSKQTYDLLMSNTAKVLYRSSVDEIKNIDVNAGYPTKISIKA